jgi:hypothetical protein
VCAHLAQTLPRRETPILFIGKNIMSYFNTGKHAIKTVSNGGKNIVLDDNSKWEISPFDKFTSMMWSITDNVIVKSYIGSKFKIERQTMSGKIEVIEATYLGL